jgi:PTS system glucose-specific IIA component
MSTQFLFPLTGKLLELSSCPESVFASKILGNGFVIKFEGNELKAPFSGVVIATFPAGHAFIVRDEKSGLEVMMHVGLKSARKEEAFNSLVKKYQRVKQGQVLTQIKTDLFDDSTNYCPVLFADPEQKFCLEKLGQLITVGDTEAVKL